MSTAPSSGVLKSPIALSCTTPQSTSTAPSGAMQENPNTPSSAAPTSANSADPSKGRARLLLTATEDTWTASFIRPRI